MCGKEGEEPTQVVLCWPPTFLLGCRGEAVFFLSSVVLLVQCCFQIMLGEKMLYFQKDGVKSIKKQMRFLL